MNKQKNDLIAKLILSISIPFILFFMLEFTIDLFWVDSSSDDWRLEHMFNDMIFVNDNELLWKGPPGENGFNSAGFQTHEFMEGKNHGVIRIFCIGDSNTIGVPGNSYPVILEEMLNKSNDGSSYEVYNCGFYGYSSEQGLVVLKKIIQYSPDFIIISFGWNDAVVTKTMGDREYLQHFKKMKNRSINTIWRMKITMFIRYLKLKYFTNLKGDGTIRVNKSRFIENYSDMIEISKKNRVKVILITRPFRIDPHGIPKDNWRYTVSEYNQLILEIGKEKEVSVLDVYNLISDPEYFIDECHFNYEGYTILSEKLKQIILESK